jgi:methyl-accepting chemotaxis protein
VLSWSTWKRSRSISRPIKRLAATLKDVAEGERDLTKTISITALHVIWFVKRT